MKYIEIIAAIIIAVGAFLLGYNFHKPVQVNPIEITATNQTQTVIKYKYISNANNYSNCVQVVDDYNHILRLYKEYTADNPHDIIAGPEVLSFTLNDSEISNRYKITVTPDPQKIKYNIGIAYSLINFVGIHIGADYNFITGGLTVFTNNIIISLSYRW